MERHFIFYAWKSFPKIPLQNDLQESKMKMNEEKDKEKK
jgi:hypothetical protein